MDIKNTKAYKTFKRWQDKNKADSKKFVNAKTGPVTGNEAYSQMTPENIIEGAKDWQENNKKTAADVINAKVEPVKEQTKHQMENALDTQKKNADSDGAFQIGDKVDIEAEPKTKETKTETEATPEEKKEAKRNLYKSQKSIWQAYMDGDFGEGEEAKRTRNYLMLDAIAKASKNIGKDIRNIGAAYSGGSIDNSPDEESNWAKTREQQLANASTAESQLDPNTPAGRQRLREELDLEINNLMKNKGATVNDLINVYRKKADEAIDPLTRQFYTKTITQLAGAGNVQTPLEQAGGLLKDIISFAK